MARRRGKGLEWSQVRVGIVLVVAMLVLLFGILSVGKLFNLFAKNYQLVALVRSAAGLPHGAPVALAGERVGKVEAIDFIPMGEKPADFNILVHLTVAKKVESQIRRDSRVRLRTQGLLGDKYIDISPGSLNAPPLQPGDTLRSLPSADFDELLANAGQALEQGRATVADMRALVHRMSSGQGTLGRLIDDDRLYLHMDAATVQLQQTLAAMNDPNGSLGRLIHDPAMYDHLARATARVDSIARLVLAGQGSLGKLIASDSLYRGFLNIMGSADQAATGLAGMLGTFQSGQGTMQRLMTDPGLYDELLKSVIDLQTMINDVRQNPTKYKPDIHVKVF